MLLSVTKRETIVGWISASLDDGHPAHSVKDILLGQGISLNTIKYLIFFLEDRHFYPMRDTLFHSKETIDKSICSRVGFLLKAGLKKSEIIDAIVEMGYSIDAAKKALKVKIGNDLVRHFLESGVVILGFGALFMFLLWWGLVQGSNPAVILVGYFPSVLTLLISILVIEHLSKTQARLLWFVPFLTSGGLYTIGSASAHPIFKVMNVAELTAINFLFSFFLVLVLFLIGATGRETIEAMEEMRGKHRPKDIVFHKYNSLRDKTIHIMDDLNGYAGILNDAIGLVYSNKHGGSIKLRHMIQVQDSAFEHLTDALTHDPNRSPGKFSADLMYLKDAIRKLTRREHEVFDKNLFKVKVYNRDEKGQDRIIDVLENNCNESVKEAFEQNVFLLFELFQDYRKIYHIKESA